MGLSALALVGGLSQAQTPEPTALARMEQTCLAEMVKNTCQVVAGPAAASAVDRSGDTVLIAGVGRIDARSYRELQDSGQAMCSLALRRCKVDWHGSACQAARALWGGASQTGPRAEPSPLP